MDNLLYAEAAPDSLQLGSGGGRARSPRRSAAPDRRPMHQSTKPHRLFFTERASARSAREGRQRGATRLHESCFINELCREISYVRDPCFVSRRTFSLADAQISHRCLGTEERCAAISHGSRCCPHDRAPAAFWTGEH